MKGIRTKYVRTPNNHQYLFNPIFTKDYRNIFNFLTISLKTKLENRGQCKSKLTTWSNFRHIFLSFYNQSSISRPLQLIWKRLNYFNNLVLKSGIMTSLNCNEINSFKFRNWMLTQNLFIIVQTFHFQLFTENRKHFRSPFLTQPTSVLASATSTKSTKRRSKLHVTQRRRIGKREICFNYFFKWISETCCSVITVYRFVQFLRNFKYIFAKQEQ